MANPNNFGVLTGRLAQEPQVFENQDGSHTVLVTLAVEDNFLSGKDRKAKVHFPSIRAFVPKTVDGIGSWGRTHKGDLISVATRIAAESYVKDGETVYPTVVIEADGYPQFLESKSTVDARAARNAVAAETPETPEQELERLRAQLADQNATAPFAGAAA
jgi:single-stranded DNA-binding protein